MCGPLTSGATESLSGRSSPASAPLPPSSGPSQASAALGTFTLHLCLQDRWYSSTSRPKPAAGVSSGSCPGSRPLAGSRRGATSGQELATARGPGVPLNSKAPGWAPGPLLDWRVQGLTEIQLALVGLRFAYDRPQASASC